MKKMTKEACKIDHVAIDLVERHGLLPWLCSHLNATMESQVMHEHIAIVGTLLNTLCPRRRHAGHPPSTSSFPAPTTRALTSGIMDIIVQHLCACATYEHLSHHLPHILKAAYSMITSSTHHHHHYLHSNKASTNDAGTTMFPSLPLATAYRVLKIVTTLTSSTPSATSVHFRTMAASVILSSHLLLPSVFSASAADALFYVAACAVSWWGRPMNEGDDDAADGSGSDEDAATWHVGRASCVGWLLRVLRDDGGIGLLRARPNHPRMLASCIMRHYYLMPSSCTSDAAALHTVLALLLASGQHTDERQVLLGITLARTGE